MWLLDTDTFQLSQPELPRYEVVRRRYAILSHTWGEGEVLFQDMEDLDKARQKAGWAKIEATCRRAISNFRYAWVDTCCIDKTSSAELSEAINSMFSWYRESTVCYVYLEDMDPLPENLTPDEERAYLAKRLPKCRWFTRGWTLQELIASPFVEFFDKEWNFLGEKSGLRDILASITNIDVAILKDSRAVFSVPVARRMSWAANRVTTRLEDRAYSLLGLFNVNMPLLYGEGANAFIRLQEHLANQVNDLSLFAWQVEGQDVEGEVPIFGGLFAESPRYFRHCSTLKKHPDQFQPDCEFTITNNGLKMDAVVYKLRTGWLTGSSEDSEADYLLSLDCVENSHRTMNEPKWLAVCLTKVGDTFIRLSPHKVYLNSSRLEWAKCGIRRTMYICRTLPTSESDRIEAFLGAEIRLRIDSDLRDMISDADAFPDSALIITPPNGNDFGVSVVFNCHGKDNFLGLIRFTVDDGQKFVIICGLQWNGQACEPWVTVYGSSADNDPPFIDTAFPGDGDGVPELEEIKDLMLCNNSDSSGLYHQKQLPSKARVVSNRPSKRKMPERFIRCTRLESLSPETVSDELGVVGDRIAKTSAVEKNVHVYRVGFSDHGGFRK